MIEKITEKKEVVETRDVVTGIVCSCDICGGLIYAINKEEDRPKTKLKRVRFFNITTSHSDWGVDSGDSFEHFNICSLHCLKVRIAGWNDGIGKYFYNGQMIIENEVEECNEELKTVFHGSTEEFGIFKLHAINEQEAKELYCKQFNVPVESVKILK